LHLVSTFCSFFYPRLRQNQVEVHEPCFQLPLGG
jgi:hypothetical protein